jgi:TRAP-type C4-dicarboxylate transport system permease small subunit
VAGIPGALPAIIRHYAAARNGPGNPARGVAAGIVNVPRDARRMRFLDRLDRALAAITACGLVLVLPVSLLLFLQWPLREWVQAWSREANDLAQVLFALYVSLAVTCATRHRAHLAADALAHRYPRRIRTRLARVAAAVVLIPWAAFMLYAAWPIVAQSVLQQEAFPDTFNPGYFILKLAVALLALLVLLQAVVDAFRHDASGDT